MCEKDFSGLVNNDFTEDFRRRHNAIADEEARVISANAELTEVCANETLNITRTMETNKIMSAERTAAVEKRCADELVSAENRQLADIKSCENKIEAARKLFEKTAASINVKSEKRKQSDKKLNTEIEKKYKADIAAEEKKYRDVVKKREKDFAKTEGEFASRLDDINASYEKSVAEIKEKIKSLHAYYKAQEEASLNEFDEVKRNRGELIGKITKEAEEKQAELNEQIKSCAEKQRARSLKSQLTLVKSSCDAEVSVHKGEIATAQKVYELKHSDSYTQFIKELTAMQKQLREFKAELDFDKAELSYERRIADAENQNRVLTEERARDEAVKEIELWRQDELNKRYSESFCAGFDEETEQKQAQCDFDVAVEEENKNIALVKLDFEISDKTADIERTVGIAEQEKLASQDDAKTDKDIKTQLEKCRHEQQINEINIFSLGLKSVCKSQKLLNDCKLGRNTEVLLKQIEKVQARLKEDLAVINSIREYQAAEYDAAVAANESFYDRQAVPVQRLADQTAADGREDENAVFVALLQNIGANRQAAADAAAEQANLIKAMLDNEENRVREQAQKELQALDTLVKEYGDMTEKYNGVSDDIMTAADEQKKNAVVDLLGLYEGRLQDFERGYNDFVEQSDKSFTEFSHAKIIERETFAQETDDRKTLAERDCIRRQDDLREKLGSFVNEAGKNKSISKGMLGEQLGKSFDARQDFKAENVQLLAQKANELKSFTNACNRAIADAKKERDKKFNDFEKLRIREEKWLMRNGKVDYQKEWWIVDFDS